MNSNSSLKDLKSKKMAGCFVILLLGISLGGSFLLDSFNDSLTGEVRSIRSTVVNEVIVPDSSSSLDDGRKLVDVLHDLPFVEKNELTTENEATAEATKDLPEPISWKTDTKKNSWNGQRLSFTN